MILDPKSEAEHMQAVMQTAYNAMLELRDTIKPNYDAKSIGYKDADHARLTIVQLAVKTLDRLASEHLRKQRK